MAKKRKLNEDGGDGGGASGRRVRLSPEILKLLGMGDGAKAVRKPGKAKGKKGPGAAAPLQPETGAGAAQGAFPLPPPPSPAIEAVRRLQTAADRERERDRLKKQRKRATAEGAEANRAQASKGMARLRAVGREVLIPEVADPARRARCAYDLVEFYYTYFPHLVYLEPAPYHIEVLKKLQTCILYGTSKALAAPRGGGKDTLFMVAVIWATAYGHRRWLVYCAAKMEDAVAKMENIKYQWETNDRLEEDFPEIAAPVRALERSPQRAKGQRLLDVEERDEEGAPTAYFSYIKWGAEEIEYPHVRGAAGGGAIISAAGLDTAIRGKTKGERRPDCAVVNDGETAQSARSEVQRETRTKIIEQDISGLAGPGKTIAKFMLCTIICPGCVAETFTDRSKKPSWDGERIAALPHFPDREDLWEEYMRLRREGQIADDIHGRAAHHFYLANRKAMDAGAEVAWPARFNANILEDGEPAEVSALEYIYNQRCDNGDVFFFAEMQNDPLPENQDTIGLTPRLVASRVGGYNEGIIPAAAVRVTRGIDVRARELHSVIKAWMGNGDSYIVDYARYDVSAPEGDLRDPNAAVRPALEYAVLQALRLAAEEVEGFPMKDTEGVERFVDLTLVDAGFLQDTICQFTNGAGPKYRPTKGYGRKQGQERYAAPSKKAKDKRPMYHCYKSKLANGQILYHVDADYWKFFTQMRFLQDPDTNGSCALWGMDPAKHRQFANHICAESFDPVMRRFEESSPHNHFLDASALSDCAAGMLGIRIASLHGKGEQVEEKGERGPEEGVKRDGRRVKLPAPSRRRGGARTVKLPSEGAW